MTTANAVLYFIFIQAYLKVLRPYSGFTVLYVLQVLIEMYTLGPCHFETKDTIECWRRVSFHRAGRNSPPSHDIWGLARETPNHVITFCLLK